MNLPRRLILLLLICTLLISVMTASSADDPAKQRLRKNNQKTSNLGPIVPDNWKYHTIGTLWTRVTNFGYMGDDAYQGRTPSCDYPGGSGNSYLYRGSIWLTAKVNGIPRNTQADDHEFAPLDSVWEITGPKARSEHDTYTRYYDVKAPLAADHFPLGCEVVERTFAWSASWAGDFVIYEYTVKNVGIDTNDDGYPDTPRDLDEFYFTFRLDADVSKIPSWAAEMRYTNQDDHALCNSHPWDDWLKLFPQLRNRPHTLTRKDIDSTMVFMWDGDNPGYPAENGQPDDFGNPGVDGKLISPGFIGIKVLKTEPYLRPHSFHVCHIYNDPPDDKKSYEFIAKRDFDLFPMQSGKPFPYDYRGILTFGPIPKFAAGDSFKLTAALGVGCHPDSGGIYSLMKLVKIMKTAQFIVDNNYNISPEKFSPPTPIVKLETVIENHKVAGVKVIWNDAAVSHQFFAGFKVWKSAGKTTTGDFIWKPLGAGVYSDSLGHWPPPAGDEPGTYAIIDRDVINGFDYYYSVQAFTRNVTEPIPLGVIETNILSAMKNITPATPVANTLDRVKVVPNPYVGSAIWNNPQPSDIAPWQHRLQFINLPADATIKIFTLDGDLVDEIKAGTTVRKGSGYTGEAPASVAEWDLISRNNQEVAPGMYMYVVDSPSLGKKVGKFVIIQ